MKYILITTALVTLAACTPPDDCSLIEGQAEAEAMNLVIDRDAIPYDKFDVVPVVGEPVQCAAPTWPAYVWSTRTPTPPSVPPVDPPSEPPVEPPHEPPTKPEKPKGNNGHGNGDQPAPGNSGGNNNAENSENSGNGNSGNGRGGLRGEPNND